MESDPVLARPDSSRARAGIRAPDLRRARERGVTALEFVLILPFFLAFVFMIFELGMMFAAQELLDTSARDVARAMRIGTAPWTGNSYASTLKSTLCSNLSSNGFNLIQSCTANLKIWVSTAPSGTVAGAGFSSLSTATVNSSGVMAENTGTLAAKTDVLLQLGYNFPWLIYVGSGGVPLTATVAFQTEPY